MEHRIFVAVVLSQTLKDKIVEWQASANLPVRWTVPEKLHITLIPPWLEQDLEKAKTMFQQEMSKMKSSMLTCRDITYGPEPLAPRLIWINCEPSVALRTAKTQLEEAFQNARENRPFVPHITLARFPRRKWKRLKERELNIAFTWEEKIQSIQLIESKLLPEGAQYQVLESVDLL